jgi:hypothetical protein
MLDEPQDAAGVEFTDTDGVTWEVREIPAPLLRDGDVATSFGDYARGWLLFSSANLRKRLAPYPADWRTLSGYELEKWCWRAKSERRPGAPSGQLPTYEEKG